MGTSGGAEATENAAAGDEKIILIIGSAGKRECNRIWFRVHPVPFPGCFGEKKQGKRIVVVFLLHEIGTVPGRAGKTGQDIRRFFCHMSPEGQGNLYMGGFLINSGERQIVAGG